VLSASIVEQNLVIAMCRRYLFGPVTATFADQNLFQQRQGGNCLAFGPAGPDIRINYADGWEAISACFPAGWKPDIVSLVGIYLTTA